jgi:hypothetical protein
MYKNYTDTDSCRPVSICSIHISLQAYMTVLEELRLVRINCGVH